LRGRPLLRPASYRVHYVFFRVVSKRDGCGGLRRLLAWTVLGCGGDSMRLLRRGVVQCHKRSWKLPRLCGWLVCGQLGGRQLHVMHHRHLRVSVGDGLLAVRCGGARGELRGSILRPVPGGDLRNAFRNGRLRGLRDWNVPECDGWDELRELRLGMVRRRQRCGCFLCLRLVRGGLLFGGRRQCVHELRSGEIQQYTTRNSLVHELRCGHVHGYRRGAKVRPLRTRHLRAGGGFNGVRKLCGRHLAAGNRSHRLRGVPCGSLRRCDGGDCAVDLWELRGRDDIDAGIECVRKLRARNLPARHWGDELRELLSGRIRCSLGCVRLRKLLPRLLHRHKGFVGLRSVCFRLVCSNDGSIKLRTLRGWVLCRIYRQCYLCSLRSRAIPECPGVFRMFAMSH
jgi:hypothetical protein